MLYHEAVGRALAEHGVDTAFGLLGDGNLFIMDSFRRLTGATFVSMSHEAGSVMAATAYAHVTGRVGLATVTQGPGLTNTLTALIEGVRAHAALVVLSGDTAVLDREAHQNVPHRDLVVPTGAGFEQVRSPASALDDLATAFRRAAVERRPIVLNSPADFQWQEIEPAPPSRSLVAPQRVGPDPGALDRAVGVVASARRPVVLAGRGAVGERERAAVLRLAERIGAPVATTLLAKDLFRGHPFDLGIFGTLSDDTASEILSRSDCVIAFGAGLNPWTTAEGSLLVKRASVHVDIDRAAIGQWTQVDAGVVGDCTTVADTMVDWLDRADIPPSGFAGADLATEIAGRSPASFVDVSTDESVDLRSALVRADRSFPAERTLVLDGGRFFLSAITMVHAPGPHAYVHTVNYGSIGMGLGHAIGAACGVPERPVLLVTGDGGFMHAGITEFTTAVRFGLDLTVLVLNDGAYGAEHIQLKNRDLDPVISTFAWPDLAPVADALGGTGYTAHNLAELDSALAQVARHRDGPTLIDVKIDPNRVGGAFH